MEEIMKIVDDFINLSLSEREAISQIHEIASLKLFTVSPVIECSDEFDYESQGYMDDLDDVQF